jgi:hypothetical protein
MRGEDLCVSAECMAVRTPLLGVPPESITLRWLGSISRPDARVARIGNSKIAAIFERPGGRWRATVFLAFEEGYRHAVADSQAAAEEWCLATARLWFLQLGD